MENEQAPPAPHPSSRFLPPCGTTGEDSEGTACSSPSPLDAEATVLNRPHLCCCADTACFQSHFQLSPVLNLQNHKLPSLTLTLSSPAAANGEVIRPLRALSLPLSLYRTDFCVLSVSPPPCGFSHKFLHTHRSLQRGSELSPDGSVRHGAKRTRRAKQARMLKREWP